MPKTFWPKHLEQAFLLECEFELGAGLGWAAGESCNWRLECSGRTK